MNPERTRAMSTTTTLVLKLTEDERALLERMLDLALQDTRVEVHRTHTPNYRETVKQQEDLIRGLLARLKGAAG